MKAEIQIFAVTKIISSKELIFQLKRYLGV